MNIWEYLDRNTVMISLATNWYIIGGCTDSSPFATVLPLIKNITMRIREVVNSLGS